MRRLLDRGDERSGRHDGQNEHDGAHVRTARVHERCGPIGRSTRPPGPRPPPPHAQPDQRGAHQQQRPHQIELLLDRERPVMLDRRRGQTRVEIVRPLSGEMEVSPKEDRGRGIAENPLRLDRVQQQSGRNYGHDRHQGCCGKNAPGPPRIEPEERDPTRLPELLDELPRDQKTRDDEEHVDPDIATRDPRVRVVEHHEQNRDRAQSLNIRSKALTYRPGLRRGGCWRFAASAALDTRVSSASVVSACAACRRPHRPALVFNPARCWFSTRGHDGHRDPVSRPLHPYDWADRASGLPYSAIGVISEGRTCGCAPQRCKAAAAAL